jgi:hypothetical protein
MTFQVGQRVRRTTDVFPGAPHRQQKKGYEFRIADIRKSFCNTEYIYKCQKNTWHSSYYLELIEEPEIQWE